MLLFGWSLSYLYLELLAHAYVDLPAVVEEELPLAAQVELGVGGPGARRPRLDVPRLPIARLHSRGNHRGQNDKSKEAPLK